MGLVTTQGKQPLFSFGVVSDVQYADIPDGRSFLGVPRYYRDTILVLERAVHRWNSLQHLSIAVNSSSHNNLVVALIKYCALNKN